MRALDLRLRKEAGFIGHEQAKSDNTDTTAELLQVLQALVAYCTDKLPPYTTAPHCLGRKAEWVSRANVLIKTFQNQ